MSFDDSDIRRGNDEKMTTSETACEIVSVRSSLGKKQRKTWKPFELPEAFRLKPVRIRISRSANTADTTFIDLAEKMPLSIVWECGAVLCAYIQKLAHGKVDYKDESNTPCRSPLKSLGKEGGIRRALDLGAGTGI